MVVPFQRVSLSLRPRVSLLKQLRINCLISRTFLENVSPKCFYSTASFAASRSYDQKRNYSENRTHRPVLLHTVIRSNSPSTTTLKDILNSLAQVWDVSRKELRTGTQPIIVILATPSFTAWLERRLFIRKIIEFLFDPIQVINDALDVTVVAAVVDGLPAIPKAHSNKKAEISEGFAIMFWERELSPSTLEQIDDGFKADTPDQHQNPKIVFSFSKPSSTRTSLDIALPLANTIFQTGRPSTLAVSKWTSRAQPLGGPSRTRWGFSHLETVRMNSLKVQLKTSHVTSSSYFDVPLKILTPLREVAVGLGNIVKQVIGADGHPTLASEELETSIYAYLAMEKLDKQALSIWALILPEDLTPGIVIADYDVQNIRASWTGINYDLDLNLHAGKCVSKGARLHRVLSGGGGWGPKQGLLALDPDRHFAHQANTANNGYNASSATLEQEHVRALGGIAKPGSNIQFLVSPIASPMDLARSSGLNFLIPPLAPRKPRFVFGSIPSNMDDIAKPPEASTPHSPLNKSNQAFNSLSNKPSKTSQPNLREQESQKSDTEIEVFNGFFGATSEAGISVRGTDGKSHIDSKVDVPYSQVIWSGHLLSSRPDARWVDGSRKMKFPAWRTISVKNDG